MKRLSKSAFAIGGLCVLLWGAATRAQQAASAPPTTVDRTSSYDLTREVNLVGTVSSFVANSESGPWGAHVLVQTAAGTVVDAHVGTAKFLELNHLTLNSGDHVRIIGENVTLAGNTAFLARIVQKGTQAVAVRSPHGMPLWLAGVRIVNAPAAKNRGAL